MILLYQQKVFDTIVTPIFFLEIKNQFSDEGKISRGVPQGSILGPSMFLIYVKLNKLLYVDDSCLMYQHRDVEELEKKN